MSRQTNFSAGELAPLYRGRSDLSAYSKGLRKMRNFFPSRHGSAVSRPGSLFVNTSKTPSDEAIRLIPFVFSNTESYALEFGHNYIRFHTNGGTVSNPVLGGPYEKVTTYHSAHLRSLKYAQTGDILTITRRGYAAMELRRLPDWTLPQSQALQTRGAAAAAAARANGIINSLSGPVASAAEIAAFVAPFNAQDEASSTALAAAAGQASFDAWIASFPTDYFGATDAYTNSYYNTFEALIVGAPHWTFTPVAFSRPAPYFGGDNGSYPTLDSTHLTAEDSTHPDQQWFFAVSLTVQHTETGRQFETLARLVTDSWNSNVATVPVVLANDLHSIYPDRHMILYRGGHLERPAAEANTINHDYREIGWNIYRGTSPLVMGLVGTSTSDRFVDTGGEPDYATQPPLGTNPFLTYDYAGNLASTESPVAVAFFEERRMLAGTYLRPAAIFGSATGDYPNFDLHQHIHVAGESVLFELGGTCLQEIVHLVTHDRLLVGTRSSWWHFGGAGNTPLDFDSINTKVVDDVGTMDATPLIVDGAVLYVRAKGSGARALRSDQGANYRGTDISTQSNHLFIGAGVNFETYGATRAIVDWAFAKDPWGICWVIREDGMLLSLTYKDDASGYEAGWAWHDSYTAGDVAARYQAVCTVPEGDEDAVYVFVKRALSTGWTMCLERFTSRVRRETAEDDACVDCGLRFEGAPTTSLTGLTHLVGQSVWVVGKDNPLQGPLTVEFGGTLELPELPTANDGTDVVLFIGLAFEADLETLDVASRSSEGRQAQKGVSKIGVEVEQSTGITIGRDFDHMTETRPHTVATGYDPPGAETQMLTATPTNKYDEGGRICIRQSKPIPTTIVSINRNLDVGG
jgi:hypothetical protein